MLMYTREQIAGAIDHTLLKTTATARDIEVTCREARDLGLYAVCIPPCYVALAARELAGAGVRIATVIAFPNGYAGTEVKAFEAKRAVLDGADEVDMVINLGAVKSQDKEYLRRDVSGVVEAAQGAGRTRGLGHVIVKVIIETFALTEDEKRLACVAAKEAGADFVKTSTGFGGGGATEADVRLMREAVGPSMGVKASGGVRSLEQVEKMLDAGATRIGASAGAAIMRECGERVRPS